MSWGSDTKLRLQIFAIVMTFLCPAFLIGWATETRRQIASSSWPSVPGEVLGTTAKTWLDADNHTKYYGRVTYRYVLEGKEYTSDLTDLGSGRKRPGREEALADVGQYRPGMKVTVYYDPHDPSAGVLEKGIPTVHLVLLVGLSLGSVIGATVTFFTIRGWVRGWRSRRAETPPGRPFEGTDDGTGSPPAVVRLGERIASFKPGMSNVVAGSIISVLLLGGGLTLVGFIVREIYRSGGNLPVDTKKGMSWLAVGIGSLLGGGLVVGGVFLARYVRWLLSHEVDLCEEGFRYRQGKGCEEIPWSGVASVRQIVLYQRPPLLKGPAKLLLPEMASKSYVVTTKDGKDFSFDGDSVKNIKRFGKLLREQVDRAGVPWEVVEEHA